MFLSELFLLNLFCVGYFESHEQLGIALFSKVWMARPSLSGPGVGANKSGPHLQLEWTDRPLTSPDTLVICWRQKKAQLNAIK